MIPPGFSEFPPRFPPGFPGFPGFPPPSPPSPRRPPRLLPAPLLLQLPPAPGPPRLRCLAPRRFPGSTFELFQGTPELPVWSVPAAPDQHWAEFPAAGAARCWRCRYRSHNGSAWLESELSPDLGDAECQRGDGVATGAAPMAGTTRDGNGNENGNGNGTGTVLGSLSCSWGWILGLDPSAGS
ncbi:sulfated surface glycoprotein 185-like [Catharus ustulatus]|uniref:sulfated surface glycoprotein 185-like n=1 Tax=Catharus ustulatus TaxID=91951 RepID=UPI00140E1D00|nr:sulfated surface glycoprotein 185-like [Catharus ustulatus]